MILKLIYTLFLALIVALFVGLGIDAFYPGPSVPQEPVGIIYDKMECLTQEEKDTRLDFEQAQRDFVEASKPYNRNASIITIISAVIILIISLTLLNKIKMIADGILLGGVFTTIYGIIRGLMSEDTKFRFIIVTVGLIIALVLGYIKFIKNQEKSSIP
jgi:hypothetical protein